MKRLRTLLLGAPLVVAALVAAMATATPAHADTVICDKYGSTVIGNRYVVQNNVWGADTAQCITVTSTGFTVTTANHNNATNGAPAAYPSIYYGCHYANCSPGTILPLSASSSQFPGIRTTVGMSYPGTGVWDAAYDIWFDPTPRTDGQNTGAEIMVWLNKQGSIQPVGSRIASASLAGGTWDVWYGNVGWNVISYVRTSATTSMDFAVNDFFTDAANRGYAQRSWYLTSVQAGFEPWVGGVGLAVNSFSVTTGGTPPPTDTQPPSTPGQPSVGNLTSTGLTLSWAASTDNVGVTGYDVYRQVNGGAFSQIGTSGSTSYNVTGLSPSTTYGFYVRARDAAGNVSSPSPTRTVTTPGGGGTATCKVTYRVRNDWGTGMTADVTILNTGTGTINGWTLGFAFAGNQSIYYGWNATWSQSGNQVTARNLSWNGTLGPNASTSIGFNANYSGGNPSPTTFTLNGGTCTTG